MRRHRTSALEQAGGEVDLSAGALAANALKWLRTSQAAILICPPGDTLVLVDKQDDVAIGAGHREDVASEEAA
jgi:hypothetical protein